MSIRSLRKIGLVMSIAMLVGTVVGIGIFFKSHGVLRANDWNGIGTLFAWIIGGVLSIAAAVSFAEIGSIKTKLVHGFAAWSQRILGKKFGYFVRFNFSFFYVGLLSAILGFFGSEMLFMTISTFSKLNINDIPIYAHVIMGLFISTSFLLLNYISIRAGGRIQVISTVLKWVPLVLVALFGIILANINNQPSKGIKQFGYNAFTNGREFKFTGMLAALPGVLFAFDAFLGLAAMRNKMEKPKKLPLAIFFGMLSVLILYLFIALAAILHGSGMVTGAPFGAGPEVGLGIFDQIFSKPVAEAMGKFTIIFLLISTLGVINGISAWASNVHEQTIKTNTVFGIKYLRNKFGDNKTLLLYILALNVFWTAAFGIPASLLNSDSIVDGMSNFPTLFEFGLFAIVLLAYAIKRKQIKETKKMNKIAFNIAIWTAIIGISFVVLYQAFYGFFIGAILNGSSTTHWGLFVGDRGKIFSNFPSKIDVANHIGVYMSQLQSLIVFFTSLTIFLVTPFLNKLLKNKVEKQSTEIELEFFEEEDKELKVAKK